MKNLDILKYYDAQTDSDRVMLQSRVLELIYQMHCEKQRNDRLASGNTKKIINKSLQYINENLSKDLSLEKVADFVSVSRIHFHNTFKSSTGKTLHEYVEEQRIRKAVNLLITTSCTLTEIAFECGFSSQSYFSFVFKRRMGTTPREYVKQHYQKYHL